jgi:hypothetical protein
MSPFNSGEPRSWRSGSAADVGPRLPLPLVIVGDVIPLVTISVVRTVVRLVVVIGVVGLSIVCDLVCLFLVSDGDALQFPPSTLRCATAGVEFPNAYTF